MAGRRPSSGSASGQCADPACGRPRELAAFLRYECSNCGDSFCSDHFSQLPPEEVARRLNRQRPAKGEKRRGEGLCVSCDANRPNKERWFRERSFEIGDVVVFSGGSYDGYREQKYRIDGRVAFEQKSFLVLSPVDPFDGTPIIVDFQESGELAPSGARATTMEQSLRKASGCYEDGLFRWRDEDIVRRVDELNRASVPDRIFLSKVLGAMLSESDLAWLQPARGSLGLAAGAGTATGVVSYSVLAVTLAPQGIAAILAGLGLGVGLLHHPAGWILLAALAAGSGSGAVVAAPTVGRLLSSFFAGPDGKFKKAWAELVEAMGAPIADGADNEESVLRALDACRRRIIDVERSDNVSAAEKIRLRALIPAAEACISMSGAALSHVRPEERLGEVLRIAPGFPWAAGLLSVIEKKPDAAFEAARHFPAEHLWSRVLLRLGEQLTDGSGPELSALFALSSNVAGGGRGNLKELFLARYRDRPENEIAIIALRDDKLDQPASRNAFRSEVQTLEHLRDCFPTQTQATGVPHMLARGHLTVDGRARPAYAVVLQRTGTLATFLRERQPNTPHGHLLELAKNLAAGVEALHEANVVHGDLKPDNVLLTEADPPSPIIADYDTAQLLEDPARMIAALGFTEAFAAPEQRSSPSRVGFPSDVYALGLILECALKPVLADGSRTSAGMRTGLAAVLQQCRATNPAERPTSKALASTLRKLVAEVTAPVTVRFSAEDASRNEADAWAEAAGGNISALGMELLRDALYHFHLARPGEPAHFDTAAAKLLKVVKEAAKERIFLPWASSLGGRREAVAQEIRSLDPNGRLGSLKDIARFVSRPNTDISLYAFGSALERFGRQPPLDGVADFMRRGWVKDETMLKRLTDLGDLRNRLEHSDRGSPGKRLMGRRWIENGQGGPLFSARSLELLKNDVQRAWVWLYRRGPS